MQNIASFTVYNASAGSGKTYAIVKNYLLLLLNAKRNATYRNILAITFTNKAVTEMKTRVVDTLALLADSETCAAENSMFADLVDASGLSENEIRQKSQQILKSLVHNYAGFEISTIDSFTNRIIRTFAKDLGLSTNFELELDVNAIHEEAVDRVVAKAGKDKQLTKVLIDFALAKSEDDKSWDITRDLSEVAKLLSNENNDAALQYLKEIDLADFHEFQNQLLKKNEVFEFRLKEISGVFFNLIQENDIEAAFFSRGSVPGYFRKLEKGEFAKLKFKAKWQNGIENEALYTASKTTPGQQQIIDELQPEIARLFHESKALFFRRKLFKAIVGELPKLSLLNTIQKEVEAIKSERNLLLISDFNKKISDSIKGQPAPFIYERLGERYRHYFIDEAQDTSRFQWQNLIPLIEEPLTSLDDFGQTGSLNFVGDSKQAIYRWRGGDPEQFMDLAKPSGINPFPVEKSVVNLPANYRSRAEIVAFNNAFFEHVSTCLRVAEHQEIYRKATQKITKSEGGYVNVSFVEGKNKTERYEAYSNRLLDIFNQLMANGFTKKELCVLVRNKEQGCVVSDLMSQNGIPVITSETLLVNNSPKVRFINHLLALSLAPDEKSIKVELFTFLYQHLGITRDRHLFIAQGLDLSFCDYLKQYGISYETAQAQSLSLYNLVEYIIRTFNLVDDSDAYVQFYLDFVLDYAEKNEGGVAGLFAHWESKKEKLSIEVPKGEDAVQIMTIHKSKGLEFPVVLYPFANERIDDTSKDSIWLRTEPPFDQVPLINLKASSAFREYGEKASRSYEGLLERKELDSLNLLYVACTRPVQQLYIISEITKEKDVPNSFSLFLSSFLRHKGLWDGDKMSYDFGTFQPKEQELPAPYDNPTPPIIQFISSPPEAHDLNIVTRSGSLWGSKQEKAIRQGLVLHDLISFVHTRNNLSEAIEKAVAKNIITTEEKDTYKTLLLAIVDHPELADFYVSGAEAHTEKEILCQGKVLRPDRVNFIKDAAVVIDYKTGSPLSKHENQIKSYAQALVDMGWEVKKKILVYINDELTIKNV